MTGRAEYTHLMRLPGMLHAKIFRSTVAHGRIKSIDTSAARKVPGVYAVYTSDDVRKVIPDPYYGPAFHDQPILAIGKVHFVGEPVAVVLASDPHVADQAAQQIVADYEELPAVFDEVEAAENKTLVHDELKPAGTFADLKHLKGRKGTNIALDFRLRRGDVDKAFATAAHVFEHTFRTQKVLHLPLEPHASIADYRDDGVTIYSSAQGPSFVRTEIARLLGWPENRVRIKVPYLGGGYGGKLYIKLEALAIALSMLARRPVKVAHHDGRAVLHHHQASEHVPHQKRPRQGRPDHRAQMRGVVERRRLCRYRPARDAEIGLHRVRSLRHRQRLDQFLRALYQPDAGRRAARLRRSAAGVGLRKPHRHDRARAQARSARIPQAESAARRPPAGDRHDPEGRCDRESARSHRRAAQLEAAVRSRQRHDAARPRACGRAQGGDLADHLGGDRQRLRRRQHHALLRHRRHGPGLRYRDGADGRRSAQHAGRERCGSCRATPT